MGTDIQAYSYYYRLHLIFLFLETRVLPLEVKTRHYKKI